VDQSCTKFVFHCYCVHADCHCIGYSGSFGSFADEHAIPVTDHQHSDFTDDRTIGHHGHRFFYTKIKLDKTYLGVILAHVTLGVPFVIITVTATLVGFDRSLIRAAQNLGASGWMTFRRVIMPLIAPGMISGALFAFITSLDEIVAVLFLADVDQRTIPRQMWSGIREQISPTILAVATVLVMLSILLLTVVELLRRRSERLRGITPA